MTDYLLPLAIAVVLLLAALATLVAVQVLRRRDRAAADQMIELATAADTSCASRVARHAGGRQDLHRAVSEQLDTVTHHLNQS